MPVCLRSLIITEILWREAYHFTSMACLLGTSYPGYFCDGLVQVIRIRFMAIQFLVYSIRPLINHLYKMSQEELQIRHMRRSECGVRHLGKFDHGSNMQQWDLIFTFNLAWKRDLKMTTRHRNKLTNQIRVVF